MKPNYKKADAPAQKLTPKQRQVLNSVNAGQLEGISTYELKQNWTNAGLVKVIMNLAAMGLIKLKPREFWVGGPRGLKPVEDYTIHSLAGNLPKADPRNQFVPGMVEQYGPDEKKAEGSGVNYKKKIRTSVSTLALKSFAKQLRKTARGSSELEFDFDDVQLVPDGPTYSVAGTAEYEMTYEPSSGDGWNEPREGGYFYCESSSISHIEASVYVEQTDTLEPVTDPALLETIKSHISERVDTLCEEAASNYEPDYDGPDRDGDY